MEKAPEAAENDTDPCAKSRCTDTSRLPCSLPCDFFASLPVGTDTKLPAKSVLASVNLYQAVLLAPAAGLEQPPRDGLVTFMFRF